MDMSNSPILLLADGRIATTALIERLLRATGRSVTTIASEEILGCSLAGQQLFVSRLCHPRLSWLPSAFRERRIPYVYFVDDNFFELTPDIDPYNGAFFSNPAVHDSLDYFLKGAKSVWVMSKPFQQYLQRRHPNLTLEFVYGAVDLALFDKYRRPRSAAANQPIRIGYPTTRKLNVASLVSDFVRGCERRFGEGVLFEFVGWCPDEIANHRTVTLFPAVDDYEKFVAFSQSRCWDIGLAPLGDSPFENAKTNVKYREYAAAYVPGVYSDGPLFQACIRHGETGLLAPNDASAWVDAIGKLVESSALRTSIALAARADIEEKHAQDVVAAQVAALLAKAEAL